MKSYYKKNFKLIGVLSEHEIQVKCVDWFRLVHPLKLMWATPNGGKRSPATGAMLKAEGVLKGVPDLFIAEARKGFHGFFIEMKKKGGKLAPHQKEVISKLKKSGYKVEVCYSLDDFMMMVNLYLLGV